MGQHFQRGRALFALKRYREAIAEYQRELAQDATCVASRTNIAASLLNLKRFEEAEAALHDAFSIDPTYPHLHYISARILENKRDLSGAVNAIKEGIRLEPSALFFYELARLLYVEKRLEEAFAATASALDLDPGFERALMLRADILNSLGRTTEAEQLLHSALTLNPENAAVHQAVGKLALHQRRNDAACNSLNNAAQIDPIAHLSLDELASAQGRRIWPLSVIDRALNRLEAWKPFRRWAFVACVTSCAVAARALLGSRPGGSAVLLSAIFVAGANAFLLLWLPAVLDVPARVLAKVRNRRQFRYTFWTFMRQDLAALLTVFVFGVLAVSVFAIFCAQSPALSFAMPAVVVNYELQFSLRPAFPKYGFAILIAVSVLTYSVAVFGGALMIDRPAAAIGLWILIVLVSASGPLYFRRLAAERLSGVAACET